MTVSCMLAFPFIYNIKAYTEINARLFILY